MPSPGQELKADRLYTPSLKSISGMDLTPTGNLTFTQNAATAFTSEETGAVANTLYLKTGNVGVGLNNPTAALHVVGNVINGNVSIFDTAATSTQSNVLFKVSGTNRATWRIDNSGNFVQNATGTGALYLNYDSGSGGFKFGTGTSPNIHGQITSSGNLLMGGSTVEVASAGKIQLPAATGAANGIYFGSTGVNLYQFSTATLKTDQNMNVAGFLGINRDAPGYPLEIVGTAPGGTIVAYQTTGTVGTALNSYAYSTAPGYMIMMKSNGTFLSPSATQLDDYIGGISAGGWTTGLLQNLSYVYLRAAENYAAGKGGTYITLGTTPIGTTTVAERVRIDPSGNVGINTTTVSAKLHAISTGSVQRLGYDANNYADTTVDTQGAITHALKTTATAATISQFWGMKILADNTTTIGPCISLNTQYPAAGGGFGPKFWCQQPITLYMTGSAMTSSGATSSAFPMQSPVSFGGNWDNSVNTNYRAKADFDLNISRVYTNASNTTSWASNTVYSCSTMADNAGHTWICKVDHVSTTAFVTANWSDMGTIGSTANYAVFAFRDATHQSGGVVTSNTAVDFCFHMIPSVGYTDGGAVTATVSQQFNCIDIGDSAARFRDEWLGRYLYLGDTTAMKGQIMMNTSSTTYPVWLRMTTDQNLIFAGKGGLADGVQIVSKTDSLGSNRSLELTASAFQFTSGTVGIGSTVSTSTFLVVGASTTGISSIRVPSGTAPSAPTSGDLWYDGTNLKFRDGVTTRTITWV